MGRWAINNKGSNGARHSGALLLFGSGAPLSQCAISDHISYSCFSSSVKIALQIEENVEEHSNH